MLDIVDKENVKVCTSNNSTHELTLSKDILLKEMQNGSAFGNTEKISRSEMVEKLIDAKEAVMSIKFHKKVDDKYVREVLEEQVTSAKKLKDAKHVKGVAKMLADGKDVEMVCRIAGAENKLGRSSIIDLNSREGMNFR